MINAKSLNNKKISLLLQEYRKKFGEQALIFEMPTGTTKLPNDVSEDELIESLQRCLTEKIKLNDIYPTLNTKKNYKKGCEIKINQRRKHRYMKKYKELVLSCCKDCIKTIYNVELNSCELYIIGFGQFCLKDDSWFKLNLVSEICLSLESFNIDFKGMSFIPIFVRNDCLDFICYDVKNSSYCICKIENVENYEDVDIPINKRSQFKIVNINFEDYFYIKEITDKEAKKAYRQELKAPLRDNIQLTWFKTADLLSAFIGIPTGDIKLPTSILLRKRIRMIEKQLAKNKN